MSNRSTDRRAGIFHRTAQQKTVDGRKGGLITGKMMADRPGHLAAAGAIGGVKGGKTQGDINAHNGHLDYARHIRHHVIDGKKPIKPCRFCNPPKRKS
jgi:hypothetical protein